MRTHCRAALCLYFTRASSLFFLLFGFIYCPSLFWLLLLSLFRDNAVSLVASLFHDIFIFICFCLFSCVNFFSHYSLSFSIPSALFRFLDRIRQRQKGTRICTLSQPEANERPNLPSHLPSWISFARACTLGRVPWRVRIHSARTTRRTTAFVRKTDTRRNATSASQRTTRELLVKYTIEMPAITIGEQIWRQYSYICYKSVSERLDRACRPQVQTNLR